MRICIVEDEGLTAEALKNIISEYHQSINIDGPFESISSVLTYYKTNPLPDLFFSDIQLTDGLSFEIYKRIEQYVPVIFCTAFDAYALNAFKLNGIDYILKPFSRDDIFDTLKKYETLKGHSNETNTDKLLNLFHDIEKRPKSILLQNGDKITPISIENIAVVYIDATICYLLTHDGKKHLANTTLENIHKELPNTFFRANRQFLINRSAVDHASHYFARKLHVHLTVQFDHKILVGKLKAKEFLTWMKNS